MRYQNWDILVFPDQSKIPLQEFKTSCQVIQDPEHHDLQTNPLLLPTVTSFIPGLPAGCAFRISIHCWQNPEISRYLRALKKTTDNVMFESRLFIDGNLIGSKWFCQNGPWPTVIELSIDLDKHGEFEKLKFPSFHSELLSQSYWNPGDDLGRIKVIISEGFSRDNMICPFERLKNIVSFSFQHAPLDVLEASSIAWPNATMWRQASLVGPYFAQQASPRQSGDTIEHGHSPRRTTTSARPSLPIPRLSTMLPPAIPTLPPQPNYDPFTEPVSSSFTSWRHASTDTSMPDYSNSTRSNSLRQVSDPMQTSEKADRCYELMPVPGAYESLIEGLVPSAPSNSPQPGAASPVIEKLLLRESSPTAAEASTIKPEGTGSDDCTSPFLKASGINNVKSRKENFHEPHPRTELNCISNGKTTRKVSQQFSTTNSNGAKRQRVTPAAPKVIEDGDEPRSSPSVRKMSRTGMKQDAKDGERKILGGIENV